MPKRLRRGAKSTGEQWRRETARVGARPSQPPPLRRTLVGSSLWRVCSASSYSHPVLTHTPTHHPGAGAGDGGAEGFDPGTQGCVGRDDGERCRVAVAFDFFDDAVVGSVRTAASRVRDE